tara:strand:+ start:875 stop:1114 length:240 start_codon:yes stop_codon:yes gene_type:complete
MTTDQIKNSVNLSNAGRVKGITITDSQRLELREAGYVVSGSTVYGPAWQGERAVVYPAKPTIEHDFEAGILARQNYSGI